VIHFLKELDEAWQRKLAPIPQQQKPQRETPRDLQRRLEHAEKTYAELFRPKRKPGRA
jgi:hypothetical protein